MNQLLQEKRDAENFLRLIAPKYAAVYILDRSTDTFRDILAPEAFRAFAKDTKGSYSDAMQLYRDHYVACDYQEVIDRVLDYDYVYNILSSGNQVNVTYRKKNGTLIRLKLIGIQIMMRILLYGYIQTKIVKMRYMESLVRLVFAFGLMIMKGQ